ncbi:MAG: ribosome recycling factor [Buchnera aphidicola (Ceratovacuna japonica)]
MINYAKDYATKKMISCINIFQEKIDSIRAGIASVSLIENISIEYYGKKVFLDKISRIIVYNTKTLKISSFDKSLNNNIVKSILQSNIGLSAYIKDNDVFVSIPFFTKEKRIKLIKFVYKEGEKAKVNVRIVRRNINIKFSKMYLNKNIDKDTKYRIEKVIQKITDNFIEKIDSILYLKKKSLENT